MFKKIYTILFLLCAAGVFCSFKCLPACTGCKNIEINENNGIYVFRIPYEGGFKVKPFVSDKLVYNKDIFKQTKAELVINAGYFDPKNQGTSSYVVMDKKLILDPETNKNLMDNASLKPHMKEILNRTEFRVLECGGKTKYEIAAHKARTPYKCEIIHSIQGGPLLYPDLRMKEEYFVATEGTKVTRDSITALQKCARTAVGLKGNDLYIIIATTANPLTLPELSEVCKSLCLDRAMNFDGGGSTSLDFKGTDSPKYKNLHIISDKDKSARKLKSFLVIEKQI